MDSSQQESLRGFTVVKVDNSENYADQLSLLKKYLFSRESSASVLFLSNQNNTTIKDLRMLWNPEPDLERIPVSSADQYWTGRTLWFSISYQAFYFQALLSHYWCFQLFSGLLREVKLERPNSKGGERSRVLPTRFVFHDTQTGHTLTQAATLSPRSGSRLANPPGTLYHPLQFDKLEQAAPIN